WPGTRSTRTRSNCPCGADTLVRVLTLTLAGHLQSLPTPLLSTSLTTAFLPVRTNISHSKRRPLCDADRHAPKRQRRLHPAGQIHGRESNRLWRPTTSRSEPNSPAQVARCLGATHETPARSRL